MNRTKIEWALNPDSTPGYTWNPITGCLNGCEYCYARKLANGRLKSRYLANKNYVTWRNTSVDFYDDKEKGGQFYKAEIDAPCFWPEKLDQPLKHKKPAGIFTCDMSDLFGIGVPEQWARSVFNFIEYCPQHRFYLLTKQPQNLIKFSPFPRNCYVGVSVTQNKQLADALKYLKQIQAIVKFISFEPLLERINLDTQG